MSDKNSTSTLTAMHDAVVGPSYFDLVEDIQKKIAQLKEVPHTIAMSRESFHEFRKAVHNEWPYLRQEIGPEERNFNGILVVQDPEIQYGKAEIRNADGKVIRSMDLNWKDEGGKHD